MTDKEIQVYKQIVWELSDMTAEKIKAYQVGQGLKSASSTEIMIRDNVTKCYLEVYFGGDNEKNKNLISVFLCLDEATSRSFQTKFILGIADKNGNKEGNSHLIEKFFERGYGTSPVLMRRADLLNPTQGYLIDGIVKLYCKLTVTAKEAAESDKRISLSQNHLNDFKRMLAEELFADFDIETTEQNDDKKILKAHKNILAFRSPFFYGMLTTDMKEAQDNVVKVSEDLIIMKEVLRFIYSSEVESVHAIANELVFAAEKYQLDELKKICIASIIKTLTPENVLQTLMAADRLTKSEELKSKCIELIVSNFKSLSTSEEWKKLTSSMLSEIIHYTIKEKDIIYV